MLGVLLSAVQWVPSKELLDRSPRAGGLSHEDLTYGSWHPELLPTLVVREAYGTRARDTDWMDGFYPYHEMNAYLGLLGLALAVVGAGGPGLSDRWTNFWVLLAAIGGVLMLGKFTFLFDHAHQIPVLGSSREPVRFHLWVSLAVAALAAVGVERLGRPGPVRLRYAVGLGRGPGPRLDPDHALYLYSGLDPAQALGATVSPGSLPLAGPGADVRDGSHSDHRPPGFRRDVVGRPDDECLSQTQARLVASPAGPGRSVDGPRQGCPNGLPGLLDLAAGDSESAQGRSRLHPGLRNRRQALGGAGLRLRADRFSARA